MTQSGQGGQGGEQQLPAARPAHEGVVLPADGGAPWTPGGPAAGGQGTHGGHGEQAAPAGGQPWGQPWGPQSDAPPQPDPQASGHYGYPQPQTQAQPLPPAQTPGAGAYQQPDAHQQPDAYQQPGAYQQPQQQGSYQQQAQQHGSYQQPRSQQQSQPLPYAQPLPPEAVPGTRGGPGAPGVPGGDADATQYIAPVPGGSGPVGMPQHGGDADATQYIPPVPGGAPYGVRPGAPGDRQPPAEFDNLFRAEGPAGGTQQMPQLDTGQQAPPPYQQPPQQGYQPQQPHRGEQLPPHAPQPHQASPGYQSGLQGLQGRAEQDGPPPHQDGEPPRRRSAHVPLIAAVVVGCAVLGLGAGALMSGGGDSPEDDKQTVAAQSSPPADEPTPKEAPDPAKPQAEALDKLLADSNNSRAAVISAVEKIKSCKDLDRANTDLKGAAQQRRDLLTRLDGLTLDELPRHAELTSSLTRAWKASAAADEHYATWARQAKKNKNVCKGGQARTTKETASGNEQSGVATQAKREASRLWNVIAAKYGLTKHAYTEL
ncbi:hypothetical protein RI138_19150 [Streptomyces sp. C11-1]|uniref:Uncharacterized protein n=1 Tax=Streptomyces durocortorensis TaxID=2811104 RepID=A0ABY9W145_9ACTN|nr:hypothetical protein [Streptomyces durocortorensis]WNF28776.1 hypothetical protein RI138_19150 [Streptomyces durocortorensis]